jgi:hypothetical protein
MELSITARREAMVLATRAHFDADMLMKGTYGEVHGRGKSKTFAGCSVGCLAFGIDGKTNEQRPHEIHAFVAEHYGYPTWLAYLQDTIFEGLPNGPKGENSKWHVQLAEAIAKLPEDYDWGFALHRVHVAILRVSYRTAGSAKEAVQAVLELHERAGRGEDVSDEMWSAARSAARSAAWSAAWSAARSAAYQDIRDAVLAALPEPLAPVAGLERVG